MYRRTWIEQSHLGTLPLYKGLEQSATEPQDEYDPAFLTSPVGVFVIERRHEPTPKGPAEYLDQLPALLLLDRLPTPVLAVGLDGGLVYTNPAFATLLGHTDARALIAQPLPGLLAGHAHTPARDCVAALKAAGNAIIAWCHAHGFPVQTLVSKPLLLRDDDPILLISMIDVTEYFWSTTRADR